MKVLLNRGTLAATLMTMVAFATMPAQAQTTFAVAFDSARLKYVDPHLNYNNDTLYGLAVTGDRVIWRKHITVSGTVSYVMGEGWVRVSRRISMQELQRGDLSRMYMGVGLGVRVGTKVQMFAHTLSGALRTAIKVPHPESPSLKFHVSDTKYAERYGVGIDIPLHDQVFVRAAWMSQNGTSHSIVGFGGRF